MKKSLIVLFFLSACQYFMGENIECLGRLYSGWQGKPKAWPWVYEHTKDVVCTILKTVDYKFDNEELINVQAFLGNRSRLLDFLNSDCFEKEKHIPWLINLFQLSYKMACFCSQNANVLAKYKDNVYAFDYQNFIEMIQNKEFEKLSNDVRQILRKNIDWGED